MGEIPAEDQRHFVFRIALRFFDLLHVIAAAATIIPLHFFVHRLKAALKIFFGHALPVFLADFIQAVKTTP